MDVVYRVAELLLDRLLGIVAAELQIFVDRPRDDSDVQALGAPGLTIDVESEARLAAIAQPFLEAEPVAFGLGDLLALFVEEHLVIEAFRRAPAQDSRD